MAIFRKQRLHPDDMREIKEHLSRQVYGLALESFEKFYGPGIRVEILSTLDEAREIRDRVDEIKRWFEAMKVARLIEIAKMFDK